MVCRVGVAVLLLAVKTKTVPLLVSAPYYNGRGAPILHRTVRALFGKDSENRAGCEKNRVNAFFFDKNIFFQKICLYLQSQTERFSVTGDIWRDAGVVDRAALEMRCTGNCTGGSNPSLSATNAENQQIAKQTPSFTPKNVKSGVFVLFKIIQPLHNKRVAILKESDEKRLIFIYPFTLIFQDFTSS